MIEIPTRRLSLLLAAVFLLTPFVTLHGPTEAGARPSKCFGKKINRVVSGSKKTVRLRFKDVAWIAGKHITVIGQPFSRICAGEGAQTIRAGKGVSFTSGGSGDDRIHASKGDATVRGGAGNDVITTDKGNRLRVFGDSGNDRIRTGKGNNVSVDGGSGNDRIQLNTNTSKGVVQGGLGNDYIIGSKSHDRIFAGPKRNPHGLDDRDTVKGMGGNDRIFDYAGTGNRLYGISGSDQIHSLGTAVSEVHGGPGTDFLYSNGGSNDGVKEKLFGEQGNDRLRADQANNNGPAILDPGEGDDWVFGTPGADTIIAHSGIKKLYGEGGDDLFVTTSRGRATIDGGSGRDTISFAAHTPPGGRRISGVMVDLGAGKSLGTSGFKLNGIEDVIGSAFDDEIIGAPGVANDLQGGLGNDVIEGNGRDHDTGDGGLGDNQCSGLSGAVRCNGESPGNFGNRLPLVDISEGGIPIAMGGTGNDRISVGYDNSNQWFRFSLPGGGVPSGLCRGVDQSPNSIVAETIRCPTDRNNLDGMLVYGGEGDDSINVEGSIPANMSTTLSGGTGRNAMTGGPSKDFMSTDFGSAGSVLTGGPGVDLIYANDSVTVGGGPGGDHLHVNNPCLGAKLSGGTGTDSTVFAGALKGVKADLGKGYAAWVNGSCRSSTHIGNDVEKLEGSPNDDWLIIGRRHRQQQGRSSLLGREGTDILDSKNGRRDTVTTGSGGHRNKVIRDRKDKVVWGWGLAAF